MLSDKELQNYTAVLSSDEDAEAIDRSILKLSEMGREILPQLLQEISNSKNTWQLRYHFLKVVEKIGVQSAQEFKCLEELLKDEEEKIVSKKILTVLSQATIAKCVKEFPQGITEKEKDWKEIYSFDEEEIAELSTFLEEKNLSHRQILFQYGHPKVASSYIVKYVIEVPTKKFMATIQAIKEFLGMDETWDFSGNCPACGARCNKKKQCPECKLKLEVDPLVELVGHPFVSFLYKERLLEEDLREHPMRSLIEKHIQSTME